MRLKLHHLFLLNTLVNQPSFTMILTPNMLSDMVAFLTRRSTSELSLNYFHDLMIPYMELFSFACVV